MFERWLSASGKFDERWASSPWACLAATGRVFDWNSWSASGPPARRLRDRMSSDDRQRTGAGVAACAGVGWPRLQQCLWRLARERNLTMEQLADTAVPHLGLQSQPRIDFGPRQFEMSLSPDLKACLIDQRRERRFDLPMMEPGDDPVKVELARAEWAVFQRRIDDVIPAQTLRLERAMRGQRRWPGEFFSRVLARHPLLGHLIRPLVWGVFEEARASACLSASRREAGTSISPGRRSSWRRRARRDCPSDDVGQRRTARLVRPARRQQPDAAVRATGSRSSPSPETTSGRRSLRSIRGASSRKQAARFLVRQGWQGQRIPLRGVWKFFPLSRQFACIEFATNISVDNDFSPETVRACRLLRLADARRQRLVLAWRQASTEAGRSRPDGL